MSIFIFADKFFLEGKVVGPGFLEIKDGKFGIFLENRPEEVEEIIDYAGYWIAPGLVDTHIHGFRNHDVMDNNFEGLNQISVGLLSCGVTSFLPTTLTSSIESLNNVVEMIGANYKKVQGAKIKGIFLEGPFFTEKHKGAQNTKYFCDPSVDMLKGWQKLSNDSIKKIAIAPERKGAAEFIEYAVGEEIIVALAHSDATYEEAKQASEKGASVFVHTFNGMSPLHHREPGMVGAAMNLKDVFTEIICDGHHVHPVALNILMNVRGREEVVMVSDCMMAGGMTEGTYQLGEFPVKVKGGMACLESGSLAGSILQLKDAVKNVVDWGIAAPEQAIYMASTAPAKSIQLDGECGKIAEGYAADFIVLTPAMDLAATYLDGVCRFQA
ncbi:N-acetylglucosamine-6-phosphate deacetylase [Bacillus paranthracis]|uniref:N-acetylglucosamine-6-phosphate deacetylase n=1 Tax=Bacillus cereus (strain Q1) TaxID=361100 RepID=B9IXZ5_BACCQ|nr:MULTISPECIES: N-acetylglucosamine-6-phosphate deacetylase [Bacillus cereus group]ACM12421.1 N-acetylglucosamine-6-phosphate deacetylase [Bacillus cereus Q1]MCY9251367.1 N-acetylglucosamine-6-phosphate deacetylase [Bacillus paranthracis]MDA1495688.1 N-acetylglucosamine-6-phosphate deacetylase [Bacillus cereus group sp. TH41-1LC]MDA1682837.1 N-acetylglucosamine-6-phosphate deacetylase [Bacillus cereus group sp. m2-21]MDA1693699.1 N-acetylglucosamine-6-phosphate deacetylase [Bacillus cereus gr